MKNVLGHNERGFSLIRLAFWLAILATVVWYGWLLTPVFTTHWKVQDAFDAISRNMANASEEAIRSRLPELFKVKYIDPEDVPEEFFDNIAIKADGSRVVISSSYRVTVWPLGPVQGVDPEEEYDPSMLKGMDIVRNKLRLDFDFEPYAETP